MADDKNRFFIFFYHGNEPRRVCEGSIWYENRKQLPSNKEICDRAATQAGFFPEDIVVTGWKELSETDYRDFTS